MNLLLTVAVLAASPPGLTLELQRPQAALLTAEPVKVVLRWRADRDIGERIFPENEHFSNQTVFFLVSAGREERAYRECARALEERIEPPVVLKKGEYAVRTLVLIRGGCIPSGGTPGAAVFDAPGRHTLRAVYAHGDHRVASNAVSFTVRDPSGGDAEVLAAVRRDLTMLDEGRDAVSQERAAALLGRHPQSRYFRWARLQRLAAKATAVHNQYDPDTGASLLHLDRTALRDFRTGKYRELAEEILDRSDWGVFGEEALVLAERLARASGDRSLQERSRRQLFDRYPDAPAVRRLKQEERDDAEDAPSSRPTVPLPR